MKRLLLAMGIAIVVSVPITSFSQSGNSSGAGASQSQTISGHVTNDKGEPLSNVTVTAKGTSRSTLTGNDGSFSITVPSNSKALLFSYVGMETVEQSITGGSNLQVQLKAMGATMDDVIVVGYTTQRKANLTGSVATVSGDLLTNRPAPNAATLLQGRVAGLQVTQPSGEPGRDNPNFLIRGRGTFGGSNDPLVLIDGVTGSFNNINPNDIENVTVLKDAASASIYGARAANGVILVTTKKGRRGQMTVSYTTNIARHTPTSLPDLITNSADYMEMFNAAVDAKRSAGVTFKYDVAEIAKYRNATDRNLYPNFNTIDYWFNPATVSNHNLSVSGGSDRSTYNLSLGYLDQNAMLPGYNFKRYNALLNYSNQISNAITVGTIMNLTYKNRQEPPFTSENLALAIYASGPLYGPFLPDGSGRIASRAYTDEGRNRNPQEYYAMGWQNTKEYNLNAQAYMDVKLLKGLTWSSKAAVNYVDEYYKMYQRNYQAYVLHSKDASGNNVVAPFSADIPGVTDQYAKSITPTIYSTLNYETKIASDHSVRVLAGYEQLYFRNQGMRGRRIATVAPILTDLNGYTAGSSGAGTQETLNSTHPRLPGLPGSSEWAMQSYFGRLNYAFKGKYLLEGNLRYDGTSKVSPEYRWGLFPSISAGWLVSEENFFRNNFDWISNFKIRASYGTLGNQDVGTYLYQDNLAINVTYPSGNTLATGAVNNNFRDQSLKWESTTVTDYGFDLNIKRGLLGVTFDWFRKYTYDILASQPVPASLGLSGPTTNDGIMRNKGIELELTHQNKIGQVNYGANFQIAAARNKLLHIRTPDKSGSTIREEGVAYDEHFLWEWDGIFQVEDIGNPKVPKHLGNLTPKPGDIKMKDQDGDGDIDNDDKIVVKGMYPDYLYSFGFNVGYKGFNLNTFFQGVKGLKNRVTGWGVDPFHQHAAPTEKWRNAWTPENRSNTMPAIYIQGYTAIQNYVSSTYFLQDASYLRLKNIVLSYDFPRAFISRIKMKDLSVYVSADNLFTITNYEGNDPERASRTGNFAAYPQAKILNFGLNIKF